VEDWICLGKYVRMAPVLGPLRTLPRIQPADSGFSGSRTQIPTAVFIIVELLIGSAQPGILPSHRDVLEVPAKPDVGAIAVTYFQTLVLAQWD
jgi:hypothetical protein